MTLPNFIVVGAAKAGTTSVYHYLKAHPQVFMCPMKETNFFQNELPDFSHIPRAEQKKKAHFRIQTIEEYEKLFEGVRDEIAIGENSPIYLRSEAVAENIKRHVPQAKIVILLRNPIQRAYSNYTHQVKTGGETRSFMEVIEDDLKKLEKFGVRKAGGYALQRGFYSWQVAMYFELFGREQVKTLLFDDLQRDANGFMKELYAFLGVSTAFDAVTSIQHNVSGTPKNKALDALLAGNAITKGIKKTLPKIETSKAYVKAMGVKNRNLEKAGMSQEERKLLRELYAEDMTKLAEMIDQDVSGWWGKKQG